MFNLANLNNLNSLGSYDSTTPWYADPAYALNSVLPSFIHGYTQNRYYNSTDGSTGFPFTGVRASNATMFDASGNLVWAPHNMCTRGQDLATTWSMGADGSSVLSGNTAPSGAPSYLTTWTTPTPSSGNAVTAQPVVIGADMTLSIYLRYVNNKWARVGIYSNNNAANQVRAWVDLETKTLGTVSAGGTASNARATLTDEGDGWVRLSLSGLNTWFNTGDGGLLFATTDANGSTTRVGNGATIEAASAIFEMTGAQTPQRWTPKFATTGSAVYCERLDTDPTDLSRRGVLVEEQRINSIRNSMMIGAVAGTPGTVPTNWSIPGVAGVTITTAYGVENGFPYVDVTYSGTNTSGSTFFPVISLDGATSIAAANGQTWTHSAYVRKVGGTDAISTWNIDIRGRDAAGVLVSGQVSTTTCTDAASLSSNRLQTTFTFTNPTIAFIQPRINRSSVLAGGTIDITIRFGGNQLEQGAFASSFIPTYGTAATRTPDILVTTSVGWANLTRGTFYVDAFRPHASTGGSFTNFGDGSGSTNRNQFRWSGNNVGQIITSAGVVQATSPTSFFVANGNIKAANRYSVGNQMLCANGVLTTAGNITTLPAVQTHLMVGQLQSASEKFNGWIKEVRYYADSSASDAQLQTLTTP